jgi:putative aldouronate transport system permease protein
MKKCRPLNSISKGSNILFNIIIGIFSILCIYPLLLLIGVSFSDEKTLSVTGYRLIPAKFSTYAYQYIISNNYGIGKAYFWTILITITGTLISLTVVSLAAYALSRQHLKYRYPITFFMFFTMMFSGGLIPSYIINTKYLNLQNSIWAIVLPSAANVFYIILMRTYFSMNIPESLIESARIDGAGELKAFFKIVIPISGPIFATIALFDVLGYWNEWYNALIYINDNNIVPLQLLLMRIQNKMTFITDNMQKLSSGEQQALLNSLPSETARMAMAVLAIGPIILAYPFFQKYFVKGMTIGAVKG